MKFNKMPRILLSGALYPVHQNAQQRREEMVLLVVLIATGLGAFFLVAPIVHWALFALFNAIMGKAVPI